MGMLALCAGFLALYLQVPSCYPTCTLYGLVAACASKHLYWVPTLPSNITHLFLEMNYISEINSTSLKAYNQLQKLDLGKQNVQLTIRTNAFLRQRVLTRLVLGYNIGLKLEPRAFAGLFRLQHLSLDYCKLSDSILSENYLQPLINLETLDLFGNEISRLRPGLFFSKLVKLTNLNLTSNQIEGLCENDLVGFQGKYFTLLKLDFNKLGNNFDWDRCGNPFRGVAFQKLDLSSNEFTVNGSRQFFKAIMGTQISHLIFHGHMGKGFSHDNLPDPDSGTFVGLTNSTVEILDLSKNRIFSLQEAVFSPFKDVIIIDMSLNRINNIGRNAFSGLQGHLRMLNLSFNLLGEIYSHTFFRLTNLRVLDLSYNHIGKLGYQAFSGLPYLRGLYLTGNSLKDLGFAASLPNLERLLLGDNKLNSIHRIKYWGGKNSTHLDLRQNRLTNLEDVYSVLEYFKRLQVFVFGGNFIKWCALNSNFDISNNTLLVLDLHDSSLQVIWAQKKCLDLFDNLENLLGLNLSHNSLSSLPHGVFSGLSSIIEIDLSSNALTYLHSHVFPVSLKTLHLSDNFLASPDPLVFRSFSLLNLAGNRFHCNCNLERFLKWLNMTNVTFLSPIEELMCEFPSALRHLPLLDYSTVIETCETDDEKNLEGLRFALFIFSALLTITLTLTGIVYAHLRGDIFIIYRRIVGRVLQGTKKPTAPAGEMKYDAFLCFTDGDYGWVESALLKRLDNQFDGGNILRCCFEARDFLPGEDHLSNIRDAIWDSKRTVCIVSQKFLKDGWCLEAFSLAQSRMLEELTNVLIMLVVGKVTHYQLMKYNAVRAFVQKREYLIWPDDPQDLEWFYSRLVSQILKDSKVKKSSAENAESAEPDIQPKSEDSDQSDDLRETQM
ncbi:toll-like receptor 5 isoform X1 [Xyrichtys novacula]|uniref:Toll-like receptor 5 isoform X1 n=1 Tax=Xyrichtys novacula TaxID=13765 RepID=A0AAV1GYQ2_XYRNO|nr:toll-like receptor 5 isoform X1 [Xyrichtys novacula]